MRKRTSTSDDDHGMGRQAAHESCLLYLDGGAGGPGTVVTTHLTFAALGEKTLQEVVENPARRIGTVHDPKEIAEGKMAASNCMRAAIQLLVGGPKELAATHALRLGARIGPDEIQRVEFFELTLTSKAYELLGPEAKLRLFDDRDNPNVRGLRHLYREGESTDSTVWALLEQTRAREHVLATLIPSPPYEPAVNVVAWAHWFAALHEEGLISARRRELKFKARELPLPADYFKPLSQLERLRRLNARITDYTTVLEESAAAIKRILKILLMTFGATVALLIGASKAQLPLQDQARNALKAIVGHDEKPPPATRP